MWDHIINIHLSQLLRTKTKESKINEHKKVFLKMDNLHFLPNNILTRLFKELKKYKNEKIQLDAKIEVQFYAMCPKLFIFRKSFIF